MPRQIPPTRPSNPPAPVVPAWKVPPRVDAAQHKALRQQPVRNSKDHRIAKLEASMEKLEAQVASLLEQVESLNEYREMGRRNHMRDWDEKNALRRQIRQVADFADGTRANLGGLAGSYGNRYGR